MKQFMPGDAGWVDRGPRELSTYDLHPKYPEAPQPGLVRRTYEAGTGEVRSYVRPAFTEAERTAIIQQGRDNPRRLTLDEERLAQRNRDDSNDYSGQGHDLVAPSESPTEVMFFEGSIDEGHALRRKVRK